MNAERPGHHLAGVGSEAVRHRQPVEHGGKLELPLIVVERLYRRKLVRPASLVLLDLRW